MRSDGLSWRGLPNPSFAATDARRRVDPARQRQPSLARRRAAVARTVETPTARAHAPDWAYERRPRVPASRQRSEMWGSARSRNVRSAASAAVSRNASMKTFVSRAYFMLDVDARTDCPLHRHVSSRRFPLATSRRKATKSSARLMASVSVSTPSVRRAASSFRWSITTFLRTQPARFARAREFPRARVRFVRPTIPMLSEPLHLYES